MKKNLLWMAGAILTCGLAFTACAEKDLPLTLDQFTLVDFDFEKGEVADYFGLVKAESALVTPEAEGSTGRAASLVSGSDRGDYVKLDADYEGTASYTIDMDLLLQKSPKTTQFAVVAQGAWEGDGWSSWLSNWGIFWKNNTEQAHTAILFSLEYTNSNTAAMLVDIDAEGAGVNSGVEWNFENNVWYHLRIAVDVKAHTANYVITAKSDGAEQVSGTYNVPESDSMLPKGIYERNGRYNYQPGAIAIDNVKIVANKWH